MMLSRFHATRGPACLGGLAVSAVSLTMLLAAPAFAQSPATPDALPQLPPPPPAAPPLPAPPAPSEPAPPAEAPTTPEPSTSAEETPPGGAASPGGSFDDVRYRDANADRVILGSTAETHPAGTFFLTDYEIALLQIGYALTDTVQISAAGVPPIVKDQPYLVDFGLKVNVARTAAFRAALTGAFDVVTDGNSGDQPFFGGRFAAIGQFCFDDHCRSSLSANIGMVVGNDTGHTLPLYGSLGLIVNVSPLVSLLAEPVLAGAVPTGNNTSDGGGVFAFDYGVRLSGPKFGVDLTFVEPVAITSGTFDNPFILGYPFAAFTYRTDGTAHPPQAVSSLGGHL
jgi:hypothetical protein